MSANNDLKKQAFENAVSLGLTKLSLRTKAGNTNFQLSGSIR
jgi:hypothetical protein